MKEKDSTIKIANNIHIIRGQKVMFGKDLADLYSVEVRTINQAVKRNIKRFPEDFCFKLNSTDLEQDGSQSVIRERVSTGNRTYPTVFTEQGSDSRSFVFEDYY